MKKIESYHNELTQIARAEGLMELQNAYYCRKIGQWVLLLFFLAFMILWFGENYVSVFVLGLLFAFNYGQLAFLAHDAAHGQILRNRKWRTALGTVLLNFFLGVSAEWWRDKHGQHHLHPNEVDRDPDITFPVVIFSPKQAHGKNAPQRFFITHQHLFFVPLVSLMLVGMKTWSLIYLVKNRSLNLLPEATLWAAHYIWYAALVWTNFDFWQGVVFVALHHVFAGLYFSIAFAPNHKGMPVLAEDHGLDNFTRQIITARNVTGGKLLDFFYGGLNYQIEHHLFPSMPRCNLRGASKIVRSFCQERGIPYKAIGVTASFVEIFRALYEVSRSVRK